MGKRALSKTLSENDEYRLVTGENSFDMCVNFVFELL